jgi:hypothetical protein
MKSTIQILSAGDIVVSKSGNKYRLRKCCKMVNLFQLQSMNNLQVGNTKWTARQLENAGVRKV